MNNRLLYLILGCPLPTLRPKHSIQLHKVVNFNTPPIEAPMVPVAVVEPILPMVVALVVHLPPSWLTQTTIPDLHVKFFSRRVILLQLVGIVLSKTIMHPWLPNLVHKPLLQPHHPPLIKYGTLTLGKQPPHSGLKPPKLNAYEYT